MTYYVNIQRLALTLGYSVKWNKFLNVRSNDLSFFEKLQLVDWMTLKEVSKRSRKNGEGRFSRLLYLTVQ